MGSTTKPRGTAAFLITISILTELIVLSVLCTAVTPQICIQPNAPLSTLQHRIPMSDDGDWPMLGHDSARSGMSPRSGPKNANVLWATELGSGITASPVTANGMVYIGTDSGNFYCLNQSNGELVWRKNVAGNITGAAAVKYGIVFYASEGGSIYALDATTGKERWNRTIGRCLASPAVADGRIYIGSYPGKMYALNATVGTEEWNFTAGGEIRSSPAIWNGKLFFSAGNGWFYALSVATGKELWHLDTGSPEGSSPAVDEKKVYFASGDTLYAVYHSTGLTAWTNVTGGAVLASPAMAYNRIFIGSHGSYLYSFDVITGGLIWSKSIGGEMLSSPSVADGVVYAGSMDSRIYAFFANLSTALWDYGTEGGIPSSPAISGGALLTGSKDGHIYCFENGKVALVAGGLSLPEILKGGEKIHLSIKMHNATSGLPVEKAIVSLASSLGGIFDPSFHGITNSSGMWGTDFIAPNVEGFTVISLHATDYLYNDCFSYGCIAVKFQPVLSVRIFPDPSVIDSGGVSRINISVMAGNIVPVGIYVNLSATYGSFIDPHGITGSAGNFSTFYNAVKTNRRLTDVIIANIEKTGYTPATLYAVIDILPGLVVTVAACPQVIPAGGQSVFTVFVSDNSPEPMGNVSLKLSSDGGHVYPERGSTTYDGWFTGVFYAPDSITGITVCRITVNSSATDFRDGTGEVAIGIVKSVQSVLSVKLDTENQVLSNGGTTRVRVQVLDNRISNPVENATVSLSISGYAGYFSQPRYENGYYMADFTAYSVAKNVTAVIKAVVNKTGYVDGIAEVIVRIIPNELGLSVRVTVQKNDIMHYETSDLTIFVQDSRGSMVSDAKVRVTALSGDSEFYPKVPAEDSTAGIYRTSFIPKNVSRRTVYSIIVIATKEGIGAASTEVKIWVSPPSIILPSCHIDNPISGSIVFGTVNMQGVAAAPTGNIERVQVQVSSDSIAYETAWNDAIGREQWQYVLDTGSLSNGDYRLFARSFNGTTFSTPVYIDVWVENPEDNGMGFYVNIIAAGIAGSGLSVLLVAFWTMRKKKPHDEP